jgi:uncharacterized cupredoxin-like copper-binding protein
MNAPALVAILFAAAVGAAPAFAHEGPGHGPPTARETPFGRAADARTATREVRIAMRDTMRFEPAEITVKRGETVRFVATNAGQVMHEMVLGTRSDLEAHAAMMKKHPDMEHHDANMVHVAPGASGEMGWRFTRPGEFFFGCLQPGHFEAGMVGRIRVLEGAR